MTATYDPGLPSELDWIRLTISDNVVSAPKFQDEEINAVLQEQTATGTARKYYAAAQLLSDLIIRFGSAGNGVLSKKVGESSTTFGQDEDMLKAMRDRVSSLRKEGATRLARRSSRFVRSA